MKNKLAFTPAICFLASLAFLVANQGQNPRWEGTIEEENGIQVIKNPTEPLYGEITFDLEEDLSIGNEEDENYMFYKIKDIEVDIEGNIYIVDSGNQRIQKYDAKGNYLQTIGKAGQGPSEFDTPREIQIDEKTGDLFVNDKLRTIKRFNDKGEYLNKNIRFQENLLNFFPARDGSIWGKFSFPGFHFVKKINPDGNIKKKLAEVDFNIAIKVLSEKRVGNRGSVTAIGVRHGYEIDLFISKINGEAFVFGNSKDYELNIFNDRGNISYKIKKDEPYKEFTTRDKKEIKRKVIEKELKRYFVDDIDLEFPEHMPFFHNIFTDCRGRIYVQRNKKAQEENGFMVYDIFNKEGYYLYRATIPIYPDLIKEGYLYILTVNEETGEESVKRYKIKNWEQIKTGI